VHLEDDVGAGLDELSLPGFEDLRRLARRVADQEIAGQRAGFGLFIRADLWAGLRGGEEASATWRLYTGPILVDRPVTLRAKAIRYGYKESAETRVEIRTQ
jgi:hypothetical protein